MTVPTGVGKSHHRDEDEPVRGGVVLSEYSDPEDVGRDNYCRKERSDEEKLPEKPLSRGWVRGKQSEGIDSDAR